ncbi:MAG: type II secretion system F family protein, partial [Planctomycetes bacterium]|nr:type II secretion system F family protein [Planctomycetota bacterium]
LILALVGLVSLLLTFLLPKVLGMLPAGEASIPLPTKILLASSDFLQTHWIWMLGLLCSLPLVWKGIRVSQSGQYITDKFLMHFPIIGGVVLDVAVARFISILRTLLSSGVEVIQALEISGGASGNAVMRKRSATIIEDIRKGALLSEAFRRVKEFNSMIQSMISMSEKTGQITQVLERVSNYFDTTIPRKVKKMIAVMEPTIICMAGILVGFVLVGTLLPLFNLYASF